jgi:hypothetical protein
MMTPEYDDDDKFRRRSNFLGLLDLPEILWTFLGISLVAFCVVLAVHFWIDLGRWVVSLF